MSGKISGFYYDEQLKNPLTSVSVFANMKFDKKSGEFVDWYNQKTDKDTEEETENTSNKEDEEREDLPKSNGTNDKFYYGTTPIVSSILVDDFQIDIANNWGTAGGDPIGSLWNNFKGIAPYASKLGEALSTISSKSKGVKDNIGYNDKKRNVAEWIEKASGYFGQLASDGSRLMNRSLSIQGSQFLYYSGTGISFNNLAIKFTILPEFKDNQMISVIDKVEDLLPYCIGEFKPVKIEDFEGAIKEFSNEYAHWQLPPGGFEANTKYIDFVQKGTLKLVIGSYYSIQNLAISSCSLVFSKQLIKNPFLEPGNTNFLTPMSCDIALSFKPITKYSRETLVNVIKGTYTQKLRNKLSKEMGESYKQADTYYNSKTKSEDSYYV